MRQRHIELACEAAQNADGQFKHGCVVVRGRKVLSVSSNDFRMHAETKALRQVPRRDLQRGKLTLYVVRLSACGDTALSKPCAHCQRTIGRWLWRGATVYHT